MAPPDVSIITPVYNASAYLSECIESVKSQTLENREHIIVDDCSVDGSIELIREYAAGEERIRLIQHNVNKGSGAARNTAIEAAEGRYIAFLDADDIWMPEKLETQIGLMQENEWAFSFSDYSIIDRDGKAIKERIGVPASIDYRGLLKNTAIGCLTVVIDTEQIKDLYMPEDTRMIPEDLALWARILRKGVIAYGIQEVLACYRTVPGSRSGNKIDAARGMWRIYREYEKLGPFLASWYFLHYAMNAVRKHI